MPVYVVHLRGNTILSVCLVCAFTTPSGLFSKVMKWWGKGTNLMHWSMECDKTKGQKEGAIELAS